VCLKVEFLDGRKMKLIQEAPRWLDAYEVPGQFIGIRGVQNKNPSQEDGAEKLLAITSSPTQTRMDSALLAATILEVCKRYGASLHEASRSWLIERTKLENWDHTRLETYSK